MAASVGEFIARRRKELGITVGELAAKLGKSRATVYRYETGAIADMPVSVLVPLAEALETTPSALITGGEPDAASTATDDAQALLQKYVALPEKDRQTVRDLVDDLHHKTHAVWQPQLTAKDRRDVERDFAAMKMASAAFYDEVKDPEAFAEAIKNVMMDAKLRAKKLYTPKKYRK